MKVELNSTEMQWIISALQHYVDSLNTMITEYDPSKDTTEGRWLDLLQCGADGRKSLISKLEKANKKKAAHC